MKRQDAWTDEDDQILAEITLQKIEKGGTQLSAFEEVAERLGRTPAACGFRWNSSVRKQYEHAIQHAKEKRQKRNRQKIQFQSSFQGPMSEGSSMMEDTIHSLDHIIRFLRQHKHEINELRRQQRLLEKELEQREKQREQLTLENREMKHRLQHMESDYRLVNDDYRTLVQIMERARKMAYTGEDLPEK